MLFCDCPKGFSADVGMQRKGYRVEGVNILKGRVRVECVERSHVAAENIGEHHRMLRMKFYVTHPVNASFPPNLISFLARLARK